MMPKLCVNICYCGIELIGTEQGPAMTPKVDAIAVGHYVGVMPVFAELALDKAISSDVIAALERPPAKAFVSRASRSSRSAEFCAANLGGHSSCPTHASRSG